MRGGFDDESTVTPRSSTQSSAGEALLDRRRILVLGEFDGEAASLLALRLMALDAASDLPIELFVGGRGESFTDALSVMDTSSLLGVKVNARAISSIEGSLLGVFVMCHERVGLPHSQFVFSEERQNVSKATRDGVSDVDQRLAPRSSFMSMVSARLGLAPEALDVLFREGRILKSQEALEMGLLQRVIDGKS